MLACRYGRGWFSVNTGIECFNDGREDTHTGFLHLVRVTSCLQDGDVIDCFLEQVGGAAA